MAEITGTQAGDVTPTPLEDQLGELLQLRTYLKSERLVVANVDTADKVDNVPYSDAVKGSCDSLGITKWDVATTVERAYELQCSCCAAEAPRWLGALQTLSQQPIQGKGALQLLVATERSLGKFTSGEKVVTSEQGWQLNISTVDLDEAYRSIGYNGELIGVDAEDAPEDYILSVHKSAMGNTTSAAERQRLSEALVLIGKARGSATMQRLGEGGQTSLSVDEAYAALSAPRDSIDDGLIM
jgi:ubiquitin carboxyl-terminal hydrolase 25/28